jgi:hypothetical protein
MRVPEPAPDAISECFLRVSGVGDWVMMRSRLLAGTDSVYAAVCVPTSKCSSMVVFIEIGQP